MDLKLKQRLTFAHLKLLRLDVDTLKIQQERKKWLKEIISIQNEIATIYPGKKVTITEDFEILIEGD